MRRALLALVAATMVLPLSALQVVARDSSQPGFPAEVQQGSLIVATLPAGAQARFDGHNLRATPEGLVVFGVGRDAGSPQTVELRFADGHVQKIDIAIDKRDWPIQRVNGVPDNTVNPPPAIAARIARENAEIVAARRSDSDGIGFAQPFIWPVQGRVSGRFGNQRIFNGTPKAPHSGMDIAATQGTPIRAPADGVVTLAKPGFFLTGGTVMIDHGHGVGSNFLHMSRIDVKPGDNVRQGDVIGAVGMTGRATGPHLHWGMTWFDVKIDPLLVLERKTSR